MKEGAGGGDKLECLGAPYGLFLGGTATTQLVSFLRISYIVETSA